MDKLTGDWTIRTVTFGLDLKTVDPFSSEDKNTLCSSVWFICSNKRKLSSKEKLTFAFEIIQTWTSSKPFGLTLWEILGWVQNEKAFVFYHTIGFKLYPNYDMDFLLYNSRPISVGWHNLTTKVTWANEHLYLALKEELSELFEWSSG